MCAQIAAASASNWQPLLDKLLLDKQDAAISDQDTYRSSFCIGEYAKAFTLIIQRTAVTGQASLGLDSSGNSEDSSQDSAEGTSSEEINSSAYIDRAIATHRPPIGHSSG